MADSAFMTARGRNARGIFPVRALAGLILTLACVSPGWSDAQTGTPESTTSGMSVQVARTAVRESASVAGTIMGYLDYGSRVSVVETKDGWSRIQVALDSGMGYGWVRASALIARRIQAASPTAVKPGANPGPARSGVSDSEVVLAGRGFIQAVEDSYRDSTHMDYLWIDAMEKMKFEEMETIEFVGGFK